MPRKSMSKVKYILLAAVVVAAANCVQRRVVAARCAAVEILWARGSGEEMGAENYRELERSLAAQMAGIDYSLREVDYPAVEIGMSGKGLVTLLGATISGGEALSFGRSVKEGVRVVKERMEWAARSCPETKFVLAGYSQGAMVMTKAAREVDSAKVLYVTNFGDPKLYLPEGAGQEPRACREGETAYSDYRVYVPDCYTYEGILGGYKPYRSEAYADKVGVWCNYHDVMCSARVDFENLMGAHMAYASDGRIADAAEMIAARARETLGGEVVSAQKSKRDVAFLIDTSGSMAWLIASYKEEALRLAQRVINDGGRVALYRYGDLGADDNAVEKLCDFGVSYAEFEAKVRAIEVAGGGDNPESLLSTVLNALNNLRWQAGANKSIIALTDAGFHNPDFDGTTLRRVVERAKEIDPVHFYAVTTFRIMDWLEMRELAEATGGGLFEVREAELLTEKIMENTVEGLSFDDDRGVGRAQVSELVAEMKDGILYVGYEGDGYRYLVTLDEAVLGFTDLKALAVTDVAEEVAHEVTVTAYDAEGVRGETARMVVSGTKVVVPQVPSAGVR